MAAPAPQPDRAAAQGPAAVRALGHRHQRSLGPRGEKPDERAATETESPTCAARTCSTSRCRSASRARFRLSRRRQVSGLVLALILLPLLTLALHAFEDELALDAQVLLYLLAVVVIAMVGGLLVAIGSAIASALLINYFFVDPVHTFTIGDPDQVVALVVFVAVAALVSGAIELAVRRAHAAERARAEAETMSALAGADLEGQGSLREVLAARARGVRDGVGDPEGAHARHRRVGRRRALGWAPPGLEAPLRFDVAAGPHVRLVGRGPALFAEDQRVLEAFAAAARTAYEGSVLSGEAEEARTLATVDQQRTSLLAAVGHDLRTPLAGIKARSAGCASPTSSCRTRSGSSCWRRSRSRATGSIRSSATCSTPAGSRPGRSASGSRRWRSTRSSPAAVLALPDAGERVKVEVPEDLPLVRADRGLLQRVLVNVLDNALRHGGGSAPVEVIAHAGAKSARLEIIDHGVGMTEQQRARPVRAVSAARRPRLRRRRARPLGRPRVRRGDGRRGRRRCDQRRRADDAHPPAARRRRRRSGGARDPGPRRRGRARPAPGARDQPARPRLRGDARRGRPLGADRSLERAARRGRARPRPARTSTASR